MGRRDRRIALAGKDLVLGGGEAEGVAVPHSVHLAEVRLEPGNRGVGIDPAVPAVRALLRDGVRPSGAPVPSEIAVFAPALALAGLLPGA